MIHGSELEAFLPNCIENRLTRSNILGFQDLCHMISPIEIGEGREKVEISRIYDTLRLLGISAKYRGYHYLAWAVTLALEDEDRGRGADLRMARTCSPWDIPASRR